MATIREVKKELRHREWAEEIAECQSSGMKIRNWCQMKGISCNTYYRRLQTIRTELLAQTEQSMQHIVPLSAAMALHPSALEPVLESSSACEKVMIRKNGIEIELPQEVSEQMLLTLMRGLRESYGSGDYEHAGCWAHCRRRFFDCIPDGDTLCPSAQIVALIDKAAEYERTARKQAYSAPQILEMRTEKIKPLLDQTYEIINTLHPGKDSALGRAVTYALNQKEKLYLFLNHPEVEMTNNLAERTVKPYVINRKNFLFSDTEKGADASAAVMSIIETAKRNNLDVYGYLLYLLTVLPEMGTDPTEDQIKSVMPWSFALPVYCKQTYSEIQ